MTTKQLTPFAILNRSLSPSYRAAAPDELTWGQEKEFFRIQVCKHWQVRQAIEKNVETTIESVKQAARECAAMGLSMSHNAQLVYFIPRRQRKQRQGESKVDFKRSVPWLVNATPSYRGLAYIATHYAGAELVAAEVVYGADKFRYFGPIKAPEHEPTLDNKLRTESKAIGAYSVVVMSNGMTRCEYVDAPTIAKIRALSDFPSGLMWTKLWTEGWRKVPVRRICKLVMNTEPRMAAATESLNRVEGITIDEQGHEVPRETDDPVFENKSVEADQTRGMAGLGHAINRRRSAQASPDAPIELEPVQPDQPGEDHTSQETTEPEIDESNLVCRGCGSIIAPWELDPGDACPSCASTDVGPMPDDGRIFPEAEDTDQPAGSVEWWAEKVQAAADLDQLDVVRAEMLFRRADKSDDADQLRQIYVKRSRTLREDSPGAGS